MTRAQRTWHLRLWLILAPLILTGLWVGISLHSDSMNDEISFRRPEVCCVTCGATGVNR